MKKHILVAEDDVINIELMREMLQRLDCDVTTAENGRKAVILGSQGSFDLIFMDLHMPEIDGFHASGQIREKNKQVPIIALTANIVTGIKQKCIDAGMNDYLSKPIELENIEAILKKFNVL